MPGRGSPERRRTRGVGEETAKACLTQRASWGTLQAGGHLNWPSRMRRIWIKQGGSLDHKRPRPRPAHDPQRREGWAQARGWGGAGWGASSRVWVPEEPLCVLQVVVRPWGVPPG